MLKGGRAVNNCQTRINSFLLYIYIYIYTHARAHETENAPITKQEQQKKPL